MFECQTGIFKGQAGFGSLGLGLTRQGSLLSLTLVEEQEERGFCSEPGGGGYCSLVFDTKVLNDVPSKQAYKTV